MVPKEKLFILMEVFHVFFFLSLSLLLETVENVSLLLKSAVGRKQAAAGR